EVKLIRIFSEHMLTIPDRVAPQLAGLPDVNRVHAILTAEIRRALVEFADWCAARVPGTGLTGNFALLSRATGVMDRHARITRRKEKQTDEHERSHHARRSRRRCGTGRARR